MMKKVFAVALASCMILSSATVFAADSTAESTADSAAATAEAGTLNLKWEDVINQEGIEEVLGAGDFVTLGDLAVAMWVPQVMAPVELTQDDIDNGFIGYYATDDQSAVASVVYVNAEGVESVEDYGAMIEDIEGVSDIEYGSINDLPVVTYMMKDTDTACVAFATEQGNLLEFSFYPASDEDFLPICGIMTASIQNVEDTEAAGSEAESVAESTAA